MTHKQNETKKRPPLPPINVMCKGVQSPTLDTNKSESRNKRLAIKEENLTSAK